MSTDRVAIDYKTHILIGVRASGIMAVIADWPHVPAQSEVQEKIDGTREHYPTSVLCTRRPSCRRLAQKRPMRRSLHRPGLDKWGRVAADSISFDTRGRMRWRHLS